MRRWVMVAALIGAGFSCLEPSLSPATPGGSASYLTPEDGKHANAVARALDAWEALERWFGHVPGYPNIFSLDPGDPSGRARPNFVWPQGQVVHAALNLAKLSGDYSDFDRIAPTLSRYLLTNRGTTGFAPPVDPWTGSPLPVRWWDDNGVTALVLLQANAQRPQRRDAGYLEQVQILWPFFEAGQWPGGGQRENEGSGSHVVGVVATSSDDETAERLLMATNPVDPQHHQYLDFALANDAAIKALLRGPNGLYWDGFYPDIQLAGNKWCDGTLANGVCSGTWWACNAARMDLPPPATPPTPHICGWTFPHNQGLMIGSDVLLYRITGDRSYLDSATRTADAALDYYTTDWLWKQGPWDNQVYFTGLVALDHYAPNPRIRAALDAYLERAWTEARDPETGLFNRGGIGTLGPDLDQSALVIMFTIQAWPEPDLPDLF